MKLDKEAIFIWSDEFWHKINSLVEEKPWITKLKIERPH